MRRKISALLLISALLAFMPAAMSAQPIHGPAAGGGTDPVASPPKTEINEVKEMIQGTEIIDPYRWLEDQNSPQTRAWINAENAYTDGLLGKLTGTDKVKERLTRLLKIDSMGAPSVREGRYFFFRRLADQDQGSICIRKGLQGKDEVLIDPLPLSPDHSISANVLAISKDGKLLIYALRHGGEDEQTPQLFDVDARKDLSDKFQHARYSGLSILPDNSGVYISILTPQGPRVFFHKFGTDSSQDVEVFGKGYGSEKIIGATVSEDGHYLVITVLYGASGDHSDIFFQDLAKKGAIVPLVTDIKASFSPSIGGDKLYLRTNWNAPKGKVLEVDLQHPEQEHWRVVIPEGNAVINGVSPVGGKLAVHMTEDVVSRVKIFDVSGKMVREITPPTLGSISGVSGRWSSPESFFSFSSFHVPPTIYRYDMATGKQEIWAQIKVPIETEKYEVKQVWYPSKDGTKIPMFLAAPKGIKLDGSNPVLLTGYGGFNLTQSPGFNSLAAAWMASGGIYAVANLRGGGEFGEEWHKAGMLEKKQNVFDDFISAAEWLIKNKYTTSSHLAIRGGSNGGLLMGAAITQRPDLFGAVVCTYPLLDMIRYQKFLVAKYWVPEYGSSDDPAQFKYIYAYSPYHHVKAGTKYPSVLLISGDSDTRVAPLHARKMTALLQASNASDKPILLHYDTQAGHSGGLPVTKQIDDLAHELMFLYWQLGVTP